MKRSGRIFSNRASVMTLVGALLRAIEWLEASHKNRTSPRVTRID